MHPISVEVLSHQIMKCSVSVCTFIIIAVEKCEKSIQVEDAIVTRDLPLKYSLLQGQFQCGVDINRMSNLAESIFIYSTLLNIVFYKH